MQSEDIFARLRLNAKLSVPKFPQNKFGKCHVLILSAALALSGNLLAADEDTVESLQAQIAGMEKKFGALEKDRDGLYEQLLQTIEELEAAESKTQDVAIGRAHILDKFNQQADAAAEREAQLQAEIESLQDDGDFMSERVQTLFNKTKTQSAEADAQQAKSSADADELARLALVQIQSALAERDAAREQLAASQGATASLEQDLQSTVNGRDYIEGLLKKEKTSSADKLAEAEAKAKSAANGRALTRKQFIAAKDEIATLEKQVAGMDKRFAAIAKDRDGLYQQLLTTIEELEASQSQLENTEPSASNAAWANEISTQLSGLYRGLSGVSVSELPGNRVGIRIGNAGLFDTGASRLSGTGRNLLSKLGEALRQQSDARVLVLGHTDNVPVGNNSSYVDNTDLSNRRALAAMKYLGDNVGISFNRMSSTGLADNYPIASNKSSEGRAQNRRIELELSPL